MTLAPIAFAACSAATPTPAETPVTRSHSPALRPPCATSMSCTTMNVSGIAPASSQERFGGTGMASLLSMSPNSAKPPGQRPMTRSPEPTTSPAASCPAGLAAPAAMRPWPAMSSPRFRLEALDLHEVLVRRRLRRRHLAQLEVHPLAHALEKVGSHHSALIPASFTTLPQVWYSRSMYLRELGRRHRLRLDAGLVQLRDGFGIGERLARCRGSAARRCPWACSPARGSRTS